MERPGGSPATRQSEVTLGQRAMGFGQTVRCGPGARPCSYGIPHRPTKGNGSRRQRCTRQSGLGPCSPARSPFTCYIPPIWRPYRPTPGRGSLHAGDRYRDGAGLRVVACGQRLGQGDCRSHFVYRTEGEKVTGTTRFDTNSCKIPYLVCRASESTTGSVPTLEWVAPSRKSARWLHGNRPVGRCGLGFFRLY